MARRVIICTAILCEQKTRNIHTTRVSYRNYYRVKRQVIGHKTTIYNTKERKDVQPKMDTFFMCTRHTTIVVFHKQSKNNSRYTLLLYNFTLFWYDYVFFPFLFFFSYTHYSGTIHTHFTLQFW